MCAACVSGDFGECCCVVVHAALMLCRSWWMECAVLGARKSGWTRGD